MPLLSSAGPSSNISWRGTLDEYPNEFTFTNLIDVDPGLTYTTGLVQITGINYKVLVSTTNNALISVNGGPFLPSPVIIRAGDRIDISITTTNNNTAEDYGKTYNTTVTVGKRSSEWTVKITDIDATPDPFFFTPSLNNEISTNIVSNIVTVTGISTVSSVPVNMISANGRFRVNGGSFLRSGTINNEDTLQLDDVTSGFYDSRVTSVIKVGTYTTEWLHTTRPAIVVVNPFTFNPVTNASLSTQYTSNTITLTGADENINGNNFLTASITSGEFRVIRNGVVIRDWSSQNAQTQNGDQIAVRLTSSSSYNTPVSAILNVSGRSGTFTITTRPAPIVTCPSQFTFVDQTNVLRNTVITSDPIILSGMTSATNDFGTATISGGGGSFRVVRNGQTITSGTDGYQTSSIQVRQGDVITLRITSSSASDGVNQTTFTVSGTDTSVDINGINCNTSDTWVVRSAIRKCPINEFNLPDKTGVQPGTLHSVTFTAGGYDTDCNVTITTSDSNSYLRIGSNTGTTLTNVAPGTSVELFMTAPYYDTIRTTTVTVSSAYDTTRSTTWRIIPVAPPLPEVTLDANPRSVPFIFPDGGSTTLTYTYKYVTNVNVTTNFGLSTITIGDGSGSRSVNNIPSTTTFTITVSNSRGSASASVQVIVGTPPPPTASLCPSDTSNCASVTQIPYGTSRTLFWRTTNATSITSSDFNTGNQQNGSFSTGNLTSDRTYNIVATGPGGTASASHTIDLLPVVDLSADNTNLITGQSTTLRWTSNLATRVVSSTGFNASSTSGSISISPTVTTTYTITVADDVGNQSQDTVTVNVSEDRTCDPFIIVDPNDPQNKTSSVSYTNQTRSSVVFGIAAFRPGSSFNSLTVTGLSPGISVTASVSGEGAAFRGGSTASRQVRNGDTIELQITNSPDFNVTRTCTLNINGVTASFSSRTTSCTTNTSTRTLSNTTLNLKEGILFFGNGSSQNYGQSFFSLSGGTQNVVRTSPQGLQFVRFTSPGTYSWTVPDGVTSVTAFCVGGGGGGGSSDLANFSTGSQYWRLGQGGGGGGFMRETIDVTNFTGPLRNWTIVVGSGGGSNQNGGDTTVSWFSGGVSQTRLRATGGRAGTPTNGGGGGFTNGATGLFGAHLGRSASRGGGGGGAGMISGNAGYAPTPDAKGLTGGTGGNGTQINGGTVGEAGQPDPTGSVDSQGPGGRGGNYGGGGGGGASFAHGTNITYWPGGNGGSGAARIEWTVSLETTTEANLINTIVNAYRGRVTRSPNYTEIQNWYNTYVAGTMTLATLVTQIQTSLDSERSSQSSKGNVSAWRDNCGSNFF